MRCDRFQGGACPLPPPAPRGSDPSRPGMLRRRNVAARESAKTSMLDSQNPPL
jgi:hypothetical protein